MRQTILALSLLLAVAAAVDEVTLLNPAMDLPPPSKTELEMVHRLQQLNPWDKVSSSDLDLADSDSLSTTAASSEDDGETPAPAGVSSVAHSELVKEAVALHDEDNEEDDQVEEVEGNGETVTEPKADLLDVSFGDLIPEMKDPRFAKMRSELDQSRAQLVTMHKQMCEVDPDQCEARRQANAHIVQDILTNQCYRRRCNVRRMASRRRASRYFKPSYRMIYRRRCNRRGGIRNCRKVRMCCKRSRSGRRSCGVCHVNIRRLRAAHRRFLRLQRIYTRLYIRYGLSLARYYRKKFRVLARVFIKTVQRVRKHIKKVKAKNVKLANHIAKIKAADAEFTRRKASEHAARATQMKQLAAVHTAHVAATAKNIADAKANIAGQKAKQVELQKAIDETKAKLAATIAEKEKHRAETEKMNAEAKNLGDKKSELTKKLADLEAQLKDATTRVSDLEHLVDGLKKQIDLLQQAVDAARAAGQKADAARNEIQTKYNDLLRRYRNAVDQHGADAKKADAEINALRDQLKELVERCVADACGVCGGDESTCANTNNRRTCYAVGDPHYRTFDGLAFDFQYDGQFLIAQHGQNFELQNLQRIASAPWQPRLNKGIAMRCGQEVVVLYEEWSFGRVLINGQSTNLPVAQWVRVGDGCSVYIQNGDVATLRYTFRDQTVSVTLYRAVWGYGNHINLYVDAPWQWSSGRSMWGLCGDYDEWVGDDRLWIDRHWGKMFVVTNSPRDMFRFPNRRTETLIEVGNVGDEDREKQLDKANHVMHYTELVEEDESVSAKMREQLAQAVFATAGDNTKEANKEIATTIPLNNVPQATLDKAKEHCGRVQKDPNSKLLQQCVFDVINGIRGASWIFGMANVKGHEKELKRCFCMSDNKFALIDSKNMKEESSEEGFSFALWFNPATEDAAEKHILERGSTSVVISQVGSAAKLTIGEKSCTCQNAFKKDNWTPLVASIHRKEGAKLFINREACCNFEYDLSGQTFEQFFNKDIVLGGASSGVATGCASHIFYVPNAITEKLAKVHGDVAPTDCKAE